MGSKDPLAPQPPPNPKRRDSDAIVEAVVEAAMQLDDPNASVNLIAERAGVGIASLYRYFPSKGAIYAEISRRIHRKGLSQLRALLAGPAMTVEDTILECCRIAVKGPEVSLELRRCLNVVVPLSWSQESANDVFVTAIKEIAAWLGTRLDEPLPDLEQRVFVAFAASRGLVMMSTIYPKLAPPPDHLVEQMAKGAMAYLTK